MARSSSVEMLIGMIHLCAGLGQAMESIPACFAPLRSPLVNVNPGT